MISILELWRIYTSQKPILVIKFLFWGIKGGNCLVFIDFYNAYNFPVDIVCICDNIYRVIQGLT